MDVFISWSGERSKLLANALVEILPKIIQALDIWISSENIMVGSRWERELTQQLESSNFGILCLTLENLNAPWILYEAGCLAKSVARGKVVPYRLNLNPANVLYPLAQFQGVDANEQGTWSLVKSLNSSIQKPLRISELEETFRVWWKILAPRITAIPAIPAIPQQQGVDRTDRELLEDILNSVRDSSRSTITDLGDRDSFSKWKTPKSVVWKTLHEVTRRELALMSIRDLHKYVDKIHIRLSETSNEGELTSLTEREQMANKEIHRREKSKPTTPATTDER